MAIRTAKDILDRFEQRLSESDAVDIAVAWATHCPAVEKLRAFCARNGVLRIVVGVDGSATDPTTLRDLATFAELRIGSVRPPASGIFHPKYYCFRKASRNTLWIGSANLTCGGFGGNDELVLETAGNRGSLEWFESLWTSLAKDPGEAVEDYSRNWRPPSEREQRYWGGGRRPRVQSQGAAERLDSSWSWDDYVANLYAKDERRLATGPDSVLGESNSWMNTIRVGHPVTSLPNWRRLKPWQADVLVGGSHWGALGRFSRRNKAPSIMTGNSELGRGFRREILRHLQSTTRDGVDVVSSGEDALVEIRNLVHGIGTGFATRLLALTRPDCYVSLNGASRKGLAECSGLPPTTVDTRYGDLLEWVHGSKWYGAPRPSDPLEGEIWEYRAALVDALVYEG